MEESPNGTIRLSDKTHILIQQDKEIYETLDL